MESAGSEFALIQTAVKGTFGLGNTILLCGDRDYGYFLIFLMSGFYGLAEDFPGEIIPAYIASFIGGMVLAVFFCLYHIHQEYS